MIRRSERPKNHYTVIANDVLRDERLSYRARGLLAALLSRPDNWTIKAELLAQQGKEGRDAVRSALKELRDTGYLQLEKIRNEDGKFTTIQVIYDNPHTKHLVAPETGNQASENQAPDFQASIEVTTRSNDKKLSSSSVDDGFDLFWDNYPRKVGKGAARKAWKTALKKADQQNIIGATILYRITCPKDPQYIAHPATWLNAERWADEPMNPTEPEPNPTPNIPTWEPCGNCHGGWIYTTDDRGYETAEPCICRP